MAAVPDGMGVSILVLLEAAHRQGRHEIERVDVALGFDPCSPGSSTSARLAGPVARRPTRFRSLFSWKQHIGQILYHVWEMLSCVSILVLLEAAHRRQPAGRPGDGLHVSILVLLEAAHRLPSAVLRPRPRCRFDPCSPGSSTSAQRCRSRTRREAPVSILVLLEAAHRHDDTSRSHALARISFDPCSPGSSTSAAQRAAPAGR